MKISKVAVSCVLASFLVSSCGNKATNTNEKIITEKQTYQQISPSFNADSAYTYVDKQVSFGSRVPNTPAHVACGDYLVSELKRFGANVTEQKADLKAFDGKILHSRNIIGSYDLDNPNRILLFAHWDSRPFSDQDPDPNKHNDPVLGANDGASGVGVLLEIARVLNQKAPNLGVDIIFFDAEDNGAPESATDVPPGDWWCLGSQYWAKNPHIPDYSARFGVLLDMVGAPDATFFKEYYSRQNAGGIVEKVWNTARDLGYGRYFPDRNGGGVYDDHVPVNEYRKIPSIDIIHNDPNTLSNFGWYWHTSQDDMNNINKETLKAVGQTVLEVVYKEQ